ncbi:LysE family translocator [Corynebacterium sp. zg912]|uniref:LysE family transporter n=1 Tax=Corynebacterium wankanglinii TaxID=2735136 RepID=A0A7V9A2D3_9CORY|nr:MULTISPECIES: LysE family transporter [Corynebacterium]MBA1837993.1 LysE family transporter [Corynebacterium wankanglinii]MCR5929233.1 LysE family translocator [Corynebacterium sp. zg912]
MIALGDLAAIVGLNLVGAAAPGPDLVLLMRTATRSRRHAWAANLGIHTGAALWFALTVFGAAALLNAVPQTVSAVQVVGGAVLVWMGAVNLRGGLRDRDEPPADLDEAVQRLGSVRSSYLRGLLTNLSNPKIVVALAAMIAPMLPASPSLATALVVLAALWLSSFALFGLIAQVTSAERLRRTFLFAGPYIDIAAGAFFIIVGAALVGRGFIGVV